MDDLTLAFDPFEGDFGAPGDKVFTNRMVISRKPGPCSHCSTEIAKGERIRRQTSKFDGELMTHRWCALCCATMASYDAELEDEDRDELPEYEKRSGLRAHHQPTQLSPAMRGFFHGSSDADSSCAFCAG